MTAFRSSYFLLAAAFLILASLAFGAKVLQHSWRGGYVELFTEPIRINWIRYHWLRGSHMAANYFARNREVGLPAVGMYLPETAIEALVDNLPASAKEWQSGFLLRDGGILQDIEVRHRGDNPLNWAFDKRSWRVKTRKSEMIDRQRVFEYSVPQFLTLFDESLVLEAARDVGILAPRSRLIELFINQEPHGILTEVERLDENFLRNNLVMPVNMYKGEQYNAERSFRIDHDLFNNPALWSKLSVDNSRPEDNFDDLAYMFDLIREAETSDADYDRLRQHVSDEDWAVFAAYQTIVQNPHNDSEHNMRLIYDNWRGMLLPVACCDNGLASISRGTLFQMDFGTHALLRVLHKRAEFVVTKYRYLLQFLEEDQILNTLRQRIAGIGDALDISMARDPSLFQTALLNGYDPALTKVAASGAERDRIVDGTMALERWLLDGLRGQPDVTWNSTAMRLSFSLAGVAPADQLTFEISAGAFVPAVVVWDQDRDGRIGPNDVSLPFKVSGGTMVVDATWLANRVTSGDGAMIGARALSYSQQRTLFSLVADVPLGIDQMLVHNALTGEAFETVRGEPDGAVPGRWYGPIVKAPDPEPMVWQGVVEILDTRVVSVPVILRPGTFIRMAPGASIVFRGRVQVQGTQDQPVTVVGSDTALPWGAFVLQGQGTSESVINHLHIAGGSGGRIDEILYTGMFSIHDTKNVTVLGLRMEDSRVTDDMLHLVYVQDFTISDFGLTGARADAIDIDVSDGVISSGFIVNSGNDAIDFMTSRVLVSEVRLERSGDKGISAGEDSTVAVINSVVSGNVIGVESKDGSILQIINSDLVDNTQQLHAYHKNWRYEATATIEVFKAFMQGGGKPSNAEGETTIEVGDSTFSPMPADDSGILLHANVDGFGGRIAKSPDMGAEILLLVPPGDLAELAGARGARQ